MDASADYPSKMLDPVKVGIEPFDIDGSTSTPNIKISSWMDIHSEKRLKESNSFTWVELSSDKDGLTSSPNVETSSRIVSDPEKMLVESNSDLNSENTTKDSLSIPELSHWCLLSDGDAEKDGLPMDHPLDFRTLDWYSEKDAEKDAEKGAEKEEDYEKAYISQNLRSAEAALKYYNKKNRTKYELVEALSSNGGLYDGIWVHCNFKAKKVVDGISSTKLFFAELEGGESGLVPTACRILRGKTTGNCEMCSDGIIHPSGGFHMVKHPKYEPRNLRPRSNSHSQIDLDSENLIKKPRCSPELPRSCVLNEGDEEEDYRPMTPEWYSEKDTETDLDKEDLEKQYISQNLRSAEAALKYYNLKNGTNYELVEALRSHGGLYDSIWVHCNFKAKNDVYGKSFTWLFFAELEGVATGLAPTCCCIVAGKTSGNCDMCPDGIIHPTGGFHMATPCHL